MAMSPAFSPKMQQLCRDIALRHGLDPSAATGLLILQMHCSTERLMLLRINGNLIVGLLNRRGSEYHIDRAARYNVTSFGLILDREMQDVCRDQGLRASGRHPVEVARALRAQNAWTRRMEAWAEQLRQDGWSQRGHCVGRGLELTSIAFRATGKQRS